MQNTKFQVFFTHLKAVWRRFRKLKYSAAIIVDLVIAGGGFGYYHYVYLPSRVRAALTKSQFTTMWGYAIDANTMRKTIVITADKRMAGRLADAVMINNYSGTHIGAEEQLATLVHDLPGKWTAEIRQTAYPKTQTVMWRYTGDKETVRYQNSREVRNYRAQYLRAKAEKQEDSEMLKNFAVGAAAGGLLWSLLH